MSATFRFSSFLSGALVAGLLCSGAAGAAPFEVKKVTLGSNGATLFMAPRDVGRASLRLEFQVGSFDDGNTPGLTRLAQYALLLANKNFDAMAFHETLFDAGGRLDISTDAHRASYTLHAPAEHFDKLAATLLKGVLRPKLEPARYPKAVRAVLQDELAPGEYKTRMYKVLSTVMPGRAYQNSPHGDRDSILSIGAKTLEQHLKTMVPANATVSVAGDFSTRKIQQGLKKLKRGKARRQLAPVQAGNETVMLPAFFEAHIIGFPVVLKEPSDAAILRIAEQRISSSLFSELRDEGLTYSSGANVLQNPRGTWLLAHVLSNPHQHQVAQVKMNEVLDHFLTSKQIGITFEQAKQQALAAMKNADESPERLVAVISGTPSLHSAKVFELINATRSSDFDAWARESLEAEERFHVHFSLEAKRLERMDDLMRKARKNRRYRRTRRVVRRGR